MTASSVLRNDFPLLTREINGYPLAYLDNASTTQKPTIVLNAMNHFYTKYAANIHRGIHTLSGESTDAFEKVREKVGEFISTPSAQCIFTKGTTESINLVAHSFLSDKLAQGDEILLSTMEHHANIIPWQLVAERKGATLKAIPLLPDNSLDKTAFLQLLNKNVKMLAISHASNVLGIINPIQWMIEKAHEKGIPVLVDGAQAVGHFPVNVTALDCDFYVFSSHKMYGPTGVGVLYGKATHLENMPPYQGGGDMIRTVSFEQSTYAAFPGKFEAGTPNIAGVIGFGAAIDYLNEKGFDALIQIEKGLYAHLREGILALGDYKILGDVSEKVPVMSIVHPSIHPHDIGTLLDTQGVAIRAGHHCAMPLMTALSIPASARIALSFYNSIQDIEQCLAALQKVKEIFS